MKGFPAFGLDKASIAALSEAWAALSHSAHNQVAGAGQVDPTCLDEPRSLHPAGIFLLAVTGACFGR